MVAKNENGIAKANKHYPIIAKKYSMPVLMANAIGSSDKFIAAGQSAIWNENGIKINQLSKENEGLLIYDTNSKESLFHHEKSNLRA